MLSFIEHYLDQTNNTRYLSIVSLTVLGYDWLISIDREVAYIWRAPWSPGRIVYHFNRIWPIAIFSSYIAICWFSPSPSAMICKRAMLYYSFGHLAEMLCIFSLLLMRYWALHNSKRVLYMLLFGLSISVALSIVFAKLAMDGIVYLNNPAPSVLTNGCVISVPSTMWTIYVAPLVYDSILFIMTVRRVWAMSKEYGSTPLMTRLAENGALHAGVLVVAVLFTCIGNKIESTKIASSGSSIFGAMPSVVCSRIMLSLHTLADREKQRYLPTTTGEGTTGSLRFGVPMQELNDASVTSLAIERFSFLQMEQ